MSCIRKHIGMDYSFFFNKLAKRRLPSALRDLFDSVGVDSSYILMGGGLPNPDVFAIKSVSLKLNDGSEVMVNESETKMAMQYGTTSGFQELVQFVEGLLKRLHDPPTLNNPSHPGALSITMTSGAQDGIYKALECLVDEGDVVLTAEPVYASFMSCLIPYGAIIESVKTDKHGIIPENLAAVLSKYPKQTGNDVPVTRKIKFLYCIPNGDNPTGIRYTEERKREIYRLAQEYNFLIMEDDAYYFLEQRPHTPSFLSMDTDGRVLRLDTFSKTVGPGFRIGYASGPKPIINKILGTAQVSSQGCSSMSQVILIHLLRKWGLEGFLEHCDKVLDFYDKRRRICLQLAEKYFQGIGEWNAPTGGMFLWVKFLGIQDSRVLVFERLVKRKVLIVAGAAFFQESSNHSTYARISYSMVSKEKMEQGFKIIAEEARAMQREVNQNGI